MKDTFVKICPKCKLINSIIFDTCASCGENIEKNVIGKPKRTDIYLASAPMDALEAQRLHGLPFPPKKAPLKSKLAALAMDLLVMALFTVFTIVFWSPKAPAKGILALFDLVIRFVSPAMVLLCFAGIFIIFGDRREKDLRRSFELLWQRLVLYNLRENTRETLPSKDFISAYDSLMLTLPDAMVQSTSRQKLLDYRYSLLKQIQPVLATRLDKSYKPNPSSDVITKPTQWYDKPTAITIESFEAVADSNNVTLVRAEIGLSNYARHLVSSEEQWLALTHCVFIHVEQPFILSNGCWFPADLTPEMVQL